MTASGAQLDIRPFQMADEPAVVALWHQCGLVVSQNDPQQDIVSKMAFQPELFFAGMIDGQVVATVMAGYEGHRGWVNYLAVDPSQRGRGLGRRMMEEAEGILLEMGCPKVNLQVRSSNVDVIEFYARIGYSVDDVVSMGKRLVSDQEA